MDTKAALQIRTKCPFFVNQTLFQNNFKLTDCFLLEFVQCFSMIRLALWVLGRKTPDIKCHAHHVISRVHTINMRHRRGCWPLITWLKECWSGFSTVMSLFLPFSILYSFGRSNIVQPTLTEQSYAPPDGVSKLFGILLHEIFVFSLQFI